MSRFETLVNTVAEHQTLATENYDRIRRLAEELRGGMCDWMDAKDGICVRLVPPAGPFQPKNYGDEVFTIPPRGFRPLGPVSFGLALRVSRTTDWLRLTLTAEKKGDRFVVHIQGGPEYEFALPLSEHNPERLYQVIFDHVMDFFQEGVSQYREGAYSRKEIGFDFSDDEDRSSV